MCHLPQCRREEKGYRCRKMKSPYEYHLHQEADRVLQHNIFRRSPKQRKLLRFLVDSSAVGVSPTQYDIATVGLGKDESFDPSLDPYCRVSISRLRRNLDLYYATNQPGEARLALEQGSYSIQLLRVGKGSSHTANSARDMEHAMRPAKKLDDWRFSWLIAFLLFALIAASLVVL